MEKKLHSMLCAKYLNVILQFSTEHQEHYHQAMCSILLRTLKINNRISLQGSQLHSLIEETEE